MRDCALNVHFQVIRNASWKHSQEWQIDLPSSMTISLHSLTSFFPLFKIEWRSSFSKSDPIIREYGGLNRRHTTHRTKRGTKLPQTSQVIDMQLHEAVNYVISGLAVGKEHWLSGALFRGLPLWISLISGGFQCLRWAEKLKLFLSSSVFIGSFSSKRL